MRSTVFGGQRLEKQSDDLSAEKRAQFEEDLVKENEALLNALGNTAAKVKTSADTLRQEVEEQNQMLSFVGSAFSRASSGVNRSVGRIGEVVQRYGFRHTLLIGVVVFFVFIFFWCVLLR